MNGPGSKASSFVSYRCLVRILAGIPIVFIEIALLSPLFFQGPIQGEESGLLRCDTLDLTSSPRQYASVVDTAVEFWE